MLIFTQEVVHILVLIQDALLKTLIALQMETLILMLGLIEMYLIIVNGLIVVRYHSHNIKDIFILETVPFLMVVGFGIYLMELIMVVI